MGPGSVRNLHGIPAEIAMTELFSSRVEENTGDNTICRGPCIDQYPWDVRIKVRRSQSERNLLLDNLYLLKAGRGGQEIKQSILSKPQRRSGMAQKIMSDAIRRSWSYTSYRHQPEGGIPTLPYKRVDNLPLAQNEPSEIADDVSLPDPIKFQPEGPPKFLIKNERALVNQTMGTFSDANEPSHSVLDLENSKASRRSASKTGISTFSVYSREGFRSFTKSNRLVDRNPSLLFLRGSSLLPCAEYQGLNPNEFGLMETQTSEYSSSIPLFGDSYSTCNSHQNLQIDDMPSHLEEKLNLDHPHRQSHELRLAGFDSYLTIESRSRINDAVPTAKALTPINSVSFLNSDEARMSSTPETSIRSAYTDDPSAVSIINVTLQKSSVINIAPSAGRKSNLVIQQNNHVSISTGDNYFPKDLSNSEPIYFVI